MTLDEAREILAVERGASADEIRDAFRQRARHVHPDRHPTVDDARRRQLGREFDRARAARDILVTFTTGSARVTTPAPAAPSTRTSTTTGAPSSEGFAGAPRHSATTPPPRRERARPRTSESRPRSEAPRVTIRFDEFVRASDAAGFGDGKRTRRLIDWPRVIAWSTVAAAAALVFGGSYVVAYVL
ncbi:DnaJ domain-containing protein [Microbacterium paulum]